MAPQPADTKRIAEAQKLAKADPSKAESVFKDVLSKGPESGEAALKDYETALMGLGELYRDQKKSHELSELVTSSRSTLSSFAKAKTAKIGELVDTPYTHVLCQLLTISSSPTPRSTFRNPQHCRYPDIHHEVMYRVGHLRTPQLPSAKPRNPSRVALHAKAVLLRCSHTHQ